MRICSKGASRRIVAGLAMAALAAAGAAQSVRIQLNPDAKKTYRYTATSKVESLGGSNAPGVGSLNMSSTVGMDISIMSKTARAIQTRFKVVEAKVSAPKDNPMAAQAARMGEGMKGQTFTVSYDSRGRMTSTPSGGGAATRTLSQMGALGFGFLGMEYPAGSVAAGAKWSATVDLTKLMAGSMPGNMKVSGTGKIPIQYHLVGFESKGGKRLARIAFTLKGKADLTVGSGQPGQSMQVSTSLDVKGTNLVDVATGVPVSGTSSGTTGTSMGGFQLKQKVSSSFTVK
jgi:hypothetical protein